MGVCFQYTELKHLQIINFILNAGNILHPTWASMAIPSKPIVSLSLTQAYQKKLTLFYRLPNISLIASQIVLIPRLMIIYFYTYMLEKFKILIFLCI